MKSLDPAMSHLGVYSTDIVPQAKTNTFTRFLSQS